MGVKSEIKVHGGDVGVHPAGTTDAELLKRKKVESLLPLPDHKKQKDEWAARMRQIFSPPRMLNDDGTVKQDFFKPKKVIIQVERRWGDADREKLLEVNTNTTPDRREREPFTLLLQ